MELRTVFLWYQITLDSGAALASLYMGIAITQEFGLGSRKELSQLAHRVAFSLVTIGWAWHVEDLVTRPEMHGLTFPNVFLHTSMLLCLSIAATRLRRYQVGKNGNGFKKGTNGSLMTGPF